MSETITQLYDVTVKGRPLPTREEGGAETSRRPLPGAIARRLRVLNDVLRPRQQAVGVPFEYVIEVTSRCNLECPMCPREISPELGNQDMDLDTFRRVLDRIGGHASFIWLAGLGEPMMNKHFLQMIRECREAGISTGASTNGTFLNDTWQERLLDSGLELLIVSFDGADKDTYEKIRVGADFDKVCENVRGFAAKKTRRGVKNPWLILQMIELSHTRGQLRAFRRMWKIPGVDSVRIKKDELQFDESLGFDGQAKRAADKPCPFLWRGTPLIQWDGTMLPCCYGQSDKVFGNLRSATVEQLWSSERVRELREAHLADNGQSEPFCSHCNTFQPGKLPMLASVLTPSLLQKKYAGAVESLNRVVRFME